MFSDADCGDVSLASSWQAVRATAVGEVQTQEFPVQDGEAQTAVSAERGTQTEPPAAPADDQEWRPSAAEADSIAAAGARMLDELARAGASHAFDDYGRGYDPGEVGDGGEDAAELHSLRFDGLEPGMQATSVAWNASGSMVLAGFGRRAHDGWCEHGGAVCAWRVFAAQPPQGAKPDFFVETSSCVLSVRAHPQHPALVAVGLYNGEVRLYNTAAEHDSFVGCSQVDALFHTEPVVALAWLHTFDRRAGAAYLLASTGGDGKVLVWRPEESALEYPLYGVQLRRRNEQRPLGFHVGGTGVSFTTTGVALVGCEGGNVLRFTNQQRADAPAGGDLPWDAAALRSLAHVPDAERRDICRKAERHARRQGLPSVTPQALFGCKPPAERMYAAQTDSAFAPHNGPVTAVAASPFHRNMFATAGADSVQVRSLLDRSPVLSLEPSIAAPSDVAWSHSRPGVLAAAADDGNVYVYDILRAQLVPAATLRGAGHCVAFNPKQRSLVVTGNAEGAVAVWQLPWGLANVGEGELDRVGELVG